MRNVLILISCLLLTACAVDDDYFGGHDNDRYDGRHGYGGGYGGGYSGYGNYYPYGNANYPRDRIYIIDRYHSCHGYAYQGYCYRNKDDYRNAVAWDRSHGYDDNWHKKRKDWCNKHDCSRGHDSHDRSSGQHTQRDGQKKLKSSDSREDYPVNSGVRDKQRDHRSDDDRWEQPQEHHPVERARQENIHQRGQNSHQREQGGYQHQPNAPHANGRSQNAEPVQQRSQPIKQAPQESRQQESKSQESKSQERKSQRGRSASQEVIAE